MATDCTGKLVVLWLAVAADVTRNVERARWNGNRDKLWKLLLHTYYQCPSHRQPSMPYGNSSGRRGLVGEWQNGRRNRQLSIKFKANVNINAKRCFVFTERTYFLVPPLSSCVSSICTGLYTRVDVKIYSQSSSPLRFATIPRSRFHHMKCISIITHAHISLLAYRNARIAVYYLKWIALDNQ